MRDKPPLLFACFILFILIIKTNYTDKGRIQFLSFLLVFHVELLLNILMKVLIEKLITEEIVGSTFETIL